MGEELTREQFRVAVADAAIGIVNIYREVELLLRELGTALAALPAGFVPFGARVVPGVKKNPDARFLRNYIATAYRVGDDDDIDDGDDADDDDGGETEDEEEVAPARRSALTLSSGECLVMSRASIYQRGDAAFEPNLQIQILTRCRVEPDISATEYRISRGRVRGLLRTFAAHRGPPGKAFRSNLPVTIEGQPRGKAKHRLVFDLPEPPLRWPLFEVTVEALPAIAAEVQAAWERVAVR